MKKFLALLLAALLACTFFVACDFGGAEEESSSDAEVTYDLEGAAEYVKGLYKDDLKITAVDYTVVSQVIVAGVTYQIDWTVDSDKVTVGEPANGVVVIGVDEKSPEEVQYKLTATIKAGDGTTTTVNFKLTVPKYEVNSHAEYMAAQKGDTLTIEGIVVAINSKAAGNKYNHLFIADANVTGGYYCYSVTEDPADLGIEVGMTVKVTGTMEPYSGMQEIKNGQVAVLDTTIQEVPVVDITEQFTAGSDLGAFVGLQVSIKGVEIGSQDLEKDTSQYLYFAIGEQKGYVRTYVTDFPTTLKADDKAAIDADHAAHFGYKADVTGILILYNGAPYLIPMSVTPFTNYVEVIKTPAEKVEAEKEALKIGASFSEDAVIDLISTGKYYDDVTITWATNNETNAAIADGKLTLVVPDDAITVTVTATITCGEATETKTFEIALSKAPITIPEALELPDGSNVLVSGTVKEINTEWSEQYGNITVTIEDAEGNTLYVYRMKTNVQVGDIITVKGVMGSYNGAKQVAAGSTATIDDPAPVEVSLTEAVALDDGRRVIVKGTVKEINTAWSEQYGNITVTIEDAEGNTLYIYRLKTNVQVGDVVTITGKVGSYNGSKQIAAGATAVIETGDSDGDEEGGATPPEAAEVTLTEAAALEDGTDIIVTVTVTKITFNWTDANGNMSVDVTDGTTTLNAYKLATKVNVGDVITITGKVGSFNSTKQIAAGATAVIVTAHVCAEWNEATCEAPKTCKVCGKTEGEALGHNYVEGECACGAKEPTEATLKLTSTALGLGAYAASTATVDGCSFQFIELGDYGDGIQMRSKNGNSSALWNTVAFDKPIARIELVYSSTKDVQYSNADAFTFTFGNEEGVATYSTNLSTQAGVKTYTITPDAETYTFFKMQLNLSYSFYWDSITIVFAE